MGILIVEEKRIFLVIEGLRNIGFTRVLMNKLQN